MVTRKEVADLAGVSEATVSRVLNGVGPIREETKERVLSAAKELNYIPNAIARSFARRRSGNLGVVLPYVPKVHLFSTYYFSEILSGIGEAVREHGYDLLLLFRTPGAPADYTTWYHSQKVDACVILGASDLPEERKALQRLAAHRLPFCLVNQRFPDEEFNEVDADHASGSYEAVKHLIAGGCRRVAFLNGSPEYSNSRDRLTGYRQAVTEAGLDPDALLQLGGNYSRRSGEQAAQAVYRERERVDGVFAANDRMAVGLMQGLRALGLETGTDVAIAGCDDSDAARMTEPPLTSVHVPFYEMGRLAADRLLQVLDQGDPGTVFREQLATRLVIRESSILRSRE
ncbi:LacI family transcriptional regulator [Paenibacillus sp. CC-CFT747]|nr:LacI family transcriptional regulator [Paenibacillus sp. CC-CFT747]